MGCLANAARGLATGTEAKVGRFVYRVAHDQWWWSDEVYRMHGLDPEETRPSTPLLDEYKHPDDVAHTREVVARAVETGEPFSCYHRIIDAHGEVRHVVAVADAWTSPGGEVDELRGYLVDLTAPRRRDVSRETDRAIRGATEHRSTIEQAKGILMFVYGVDADTAFAILSARSQEHNVKVRDLATQVTDDTALSAQSRVLQRRLTELLESGAADPDEHDPSSTPVGVPRSRSGYGSVHDSRA